MTGVRNHGARRVAAETSANAPQKENQHAQRNGEFFREVEFASETKYRAEKTQQEIEEDVCPLMGDPEPGSLTAPDQLREPRIVDMTPEIGCFDATVPAARQRGPARKLRGFGACARGRRATIARALIHSLAGQGCHELDSSLWGRAAGQMPRFLSLVSAAEEGPAGRPSFRSGQAGATEPRTCKQR